MHALAYIPPDLKLPYSNPYCIITWDDAATVLLTIQRIVTYTQVALTWSANSYPHNSRSRQQVLLLYTRGPHIYSVLSSLFDKHPGLPGSCSGTIACSANTSQSISLYIDLDQDLEETESSQKLKETTQEEEG